MRKNKKLVSVFLTGTMAAGMIGGVAQAAEGTPLVVAVTTFNEKFSPLFAEQTYDQDVCDVIFPWLLTLDRSGSPVWNGIEGETREYNGTEYTYYGMADVTQTRDEEADETIYNFKLREDITFTDGVNLTADDVIFSLYAYCDPSYDGNQTLYSQNIKGLKNYRANSTAAESVTSDKVDEVMDEMPEALKAKIVDELIVPLLTDEMGWCEDNYEGYDMESAIEMYVAFYALDESYDPGEKTQEEVIADVVAMYDGDYATLGANYGDEEGITEEAKTVAENYLIDELKESGEGEEVPNIEGIKKLGDYEVEVTLDGYDATTPYRFNIGIVPLHYYGDESQYDYENNQFGFTRGDLSSMKEKSTKPLGYGPYKFVKYENKIVYLEANENYFLGAPKTKNIQMKETDDSDKIPAVQQGTADIADPSGSKSAFAQIGGINGNGELNGDVINTITTDNLGYGYIGINASTVNVGGEPGSEESKNLRKAIATILSVYRDVNIDSYYGDAAAVIDYPISNTSWAAPQKSDADYHAAFSVDVNGNDIYADGMTAEEKYEAAKQAALGYLEAAGYTVKDGKVTAAPEGAKMSYEIMVGADGKGDHPSFGIMADAKKALGEIGLELNINDLSDTSQLFDSMSAHTTELWAAAWAADADPDMYQVYYSNQPSNHYCIADPELDKLIMEARTSDDQSYRKPLYKEALEIIIDWGVEVPVYQRQNCVIYSSQRVNADTFTKDATPFYQWIKDIALIEMN
ncbi:MAG: ABC transporter substrate-binding protein [Robinsoniella sp.]|nr:ABC transporter substrate-binding protein [Robinsoniella sp.]